MNLYDWPEYANPGLVEASAQLDPGSSSGGIDMTHSDTTGQHDMRRRRHTPEQMICKLAEGEKLLGQGQSIEVVAQDLEIIDLTALAQPVRQRESRGRKALQGVR